MDCCKKGAVYLRLVTDSPSPFPKFQHVQMLTEAWDSGAVVQGYAIEEIAIKIFPWCGTSFSLRNAQRNARAKA